MEDGTSWSPGAGAGCAARGSAWRGPASGAACGAGQSRGHYDHYDHYGHYGHHDHCSGGHWADARYGPRGGPAPESETRSTAEVEL